MTKEIDGPQSDYPSPEDMQKWLAQEVKDIAKASELRLAEASSIVSAYTRGEMSAEEAAERSWRYVNRWQEALPGCTAGSGFSDEQILQTIDDVRSGQLNDELPKWSSMALKVTSKKQSR